MFQPTRSLVFLPPSVRTNQIVAMLTHDGCHTYIAHEFDDVLNLVKALPFDFVLIDETLSSDELKPLTLAIRRSPVAHNAQLLMFGDTATLRSAESISATVRSHVIRHPFPLRQLRDYLMHLRDGGHSRAAI